MKRVYLFLSITCGIQWASAMQEEHALFQTADNEIFEVKLKTVALSPTLQWLYDNSCKNSDEAIQLPNTIDSRNFLHCLDLLFFKQRIPHLNDDKIEYWWRKESSYICSNKQLFKTLRYLDIKDPCLVKVQFTDKKLIILKSWLRQLSPVYKNLYLPDYETIKLDIPSDIIIDSPIKQSSMNATINLKKFLQKIKAFDYLGNESITNDGIRRLVAYIKMELAINTITEITDELSDGLAEIPNTIAVPIFESFESYDDNVYEILNDTDLDLKQQVSLLLFQYLLFQDCGNASLFDLPMFYTFPAQWQQQLKNILHDLGKTDVLEKLNERKETVNSENGLTILTINKITDELYKTIESYCKNKNLTDIDNNAINTQLYAMINKVPTNDLIDKILDALYKKIKKISSESGPFRVKIEKLPETISQFIGATDYTKILDYILFIYLALHGGYVGLISIELLTKLPNDMQNSIYSIMYKDIIPSHTLLGKIYPYIVSFTAAYGLATVGYCAKYCIENRIKSYFGINECASLKKQCLLGAIRLGLFVPLLPGSLFSAAELTLSSKMGLYEGPTVLAGISLGLVITHYACSTFNKKS